MHEMQGGSDHDFSGIKDFCNMASDCTLANLGCIGENITWMNGQGDGD